MWLEMRGALHPYGRRRRRGRRGGDARLLGGGGFSGTGAPLLAEAPGGVVGSAEAAQAGEGPLRDPLGLVAGVDMDSSFSPC